MEPGPGQLKPYELDLWAGWAQGEQGGVRWGELGWGGVGLWPRAFEFDLSHVMLTDSHHRIGC